MNNYQKINFLLFFTMLVLSSCRIVKDIDIIDCMNTRPSPYRYDEFITRYIQAKQIYHFQDTVAVYEISLPKNYDKDLFRRTNGQFDAADVTLYYGYGCSHVFFMEQNGVSPNDAKIDQQYPDNHNLNWNYYITNYIYPPTVILEGVDTNRLYWKDIRFEWVRYGYSNVKQEDKAIFDSIVNSIKRIK